MFDAVDKEVAGRKLLPQDESGTPEQHLSRGEDPSTGVVERERVVDNVVWCEGAKQVDAMGHHIEPTAVRMMNVDGCTTLYSTNLSLLFLMSD